jgi:hypothetical protein
MKDQKMYLINGQVDSKKNKIVVEYADCNHKVI